MSSTDPKATTTYADALRVCIDFNDNDIDTATEHSPEYLRGQLELIADCFAIPGTYIGGRIEQVRADIEDIIEDEKTDQRVQVAAEVTEKLTKLYEVCDGDEAQVGEMMYEIDKAARLNSRVGG